ncbi:MAG: hypothetical protein HQK54_11760, partial [Oligoflexales bacterium]|nr:hypothetical protein [Oligoflexales bacterium]
MKMDHSKPNLNVRLCLCLLMLLSFSFLTGCGLTDDSESSSSLKYRIPGTSGNSNIHELVKERYHDTVSLPDLIRQFESQREAVKFMDRLFKVVKLSVGIDVKENAEQYDLAFRPEMLLDLLQFTVGQLDAARKIATGIARHSPALPGEGIYLPSALKSVNQLPTTFDYGMADRISIELAPTRPPENSPKIYFGFFRSEADDETEIVQNTIFSEVIERLSTNIAAERKKQFRVIYNGRAYARLDHFLRALSENGHEMTAMVRHYIAPFIPAYVKTEDGSSLAIAAAVFQRTGIWHGNEREAILPPIHSEIVFSVKSGRKTAGQRINAAMRYFQGVPKMGFYGEKSTKIENWLGLKVSDRFSGEEAHRALLLAGYLVDMNRTLVYRKKLIADGWGTVGVCNDSVAIVQMAVKGYVNSYPIFKIDSE